VHVYAEHVLAFACIAVQPPVIDDADACTTGLGTPLIFCLCACAGCCASSMWRKMRSLVCTWCVACSSLCGTRCTLSNYLNKGMRTPCGVTASAMPVLIEAKLPVMCTLMQVFEYLTTDLKKYMDKNGKGPNFPLPKTTVKVCYQTDNICLACTAQYCLYILMPTCINRSPGPQSHWLTM
jgi:hypothetical protein